MCQLYFDVLLDRKLKDAFYLRTLHRPGFTKPLVGFWS